MARWFILRVQQMAKIVLYSILILITAVDSTIQFLSSMFKKSEDSSVKRNSSIADLRRKLDRNADFSSSYRDELRTLKSKVDSLSSKNSSLESTNISLLNRIKDLEKMLEQEREWHNEALNAKDEQICNLRDEIDRQLSEYRDLLDIKVALDLEISAYRKLLEGEESSPSSSRASSLGTQVSSKASGDISVSDHDIGGKSVKIHNKGKQASDDEEHDYQMAELFEEEKQLLYLERVPKIIQILSLYYDGSKVKKLHDVIERLQLTFSSSTYDDIKENLQLLRNYVPGWITTTRHRLEDEVVLMNHNIDVSFYLQITDDQIYGPE